MLKALRRSIELRSFDVRRRMASGLSDIYKAFAVSGALVIGLTPLPSYADPAPPSTKNLSAPLVAPGTAASYYGPATGHSTGLTAANQIWTSPEIQTLATSLLGGRNVGNPTDQAAFINNVYNYVLNNINTEFRYGLSKGCLLYTSPSPRDS